MNADYWLCGLHISIYSYNKGEYSLIIKIISHFHLPYLLKNVPRHPVGEREGE
jgi:hypothetical protein